MEGKLLLAAEAQRWDLERAPLAELVCGWKERKMWLLLFAPYQNVEIWLEARTEGSRVVGLGEGDEQTASMAFPLFETLLKLN